MTKTTGPNSTIPAEKGLRAQRAPIAIIGIGCRFPGGANSPAKYWENLVEGVDAISEIPDQRWNQRQFYSPQQGESGKTQTRWAGLVENLDQFDPQFFGISPREAARMDPQQRMLLEVAWEAIEDAGQPLESLSGTRTAVFTGISSWDYAYQGMSFQDRGVINAYNNTGGSLSIASNRVAYCLDLRGPSVSVDTACSSALVALHMACQSIWHDGCPAALAGGVNALLMPDFFVAFSQLSMLSPDGRCKAFDARANGFVRSEGAGMVLLKPLDQALTDDNRIYAVIRGTAVNQDGRTPGMTVPRQEAQESLVRQACAGAGVSPGMIQYVEAHGTGTQVGDPIETRALGTVLSTQRPADAPCIIGSVKTNIGHLEAGAGIASVIKVALALHHNSIPGNLHFEQPNPEIDFEHLKLRIPVQCEQWPDGDGPKLAGINGFGYGGTNAHVILQDGPARQKASPNESTTAPDHAQLVCLSARAPAALQAVAAATQQFLDSGNSGVTLNEVAGYTAHRRTHHEHRLALVTSSIDDLSEQLTAYAQDQPLPGTVTNRAISGEPPQVAFVCSGQGPQWWAMGRQLLEQESIFQDIIDRCDAVSRQLGPWSLKEELLADEAHSRMAMTAVAQPSIFAVQVALAEVWRKWGVEPSALVGHSVGEVAAAHLAGVFSLEEAFRVVYHRGRCMDLASSRGRMLAAGLSREEAQQIVSKYGADVTIAAFNSPTSVTLSGTARRLEEIAAELEERQVFWRNLKVEYAFHSAQMDPVRDELLESLHDLHPTQANRPLVSTVTGDWVEGPELDAEYWWLNVRKTVRFADAIDRIARTSSKIALELSPHPVLTYSVTECCQAAGKQLHVVSSLRRSEPERATMLRSLGELHTLGYPIDWEQVAPRPQRLLSMPTYPWQRQRCWNESYESRETRSAMPQHPLLGTRQCNPTPTWQNRLDLQRYQYLADHRVQGMTVFPATGYAEMALAAAINVTGRPRCRIDRLQLVHPCILSTDEAHWFEVHCDKDDRLLRIYSRAADRSGDWTLHATAEFSTLAVEQPKTRLPLDEIKQRCTRPFDRDTCYEYIHKLGLDYGPLFQGIEQGWRRAGESLTAVEIPESSARASDDYFVHPALLDACFQSVITADHDFDEYVDGLYLPAEIHKIWFHQRPGRRALCHSRVLEKTAAYQVADLDLYDEEGNLLLEIRGLRSRRVAGSSKEESLDDLLYNYMWQPQPLTVADTESESSDKATVTQSGKWILLADKTGVAEDLANRLRAQGEQLVLVYRGDRFLRVESDCYQINAVERDDMIELLRCTSSEDSIAIRGIVHLWNLDAPGSEGLTSTDLEAAQDPGVLSLLHLVQAWDAVLGDKNARLTLVTRGAQSVGPQPEPVAVAQSPAIGFGRVIVSEYPKLQCKQVDLDPSWEAATCPTLIDEILADDEEDEVALRAEKRYVHRYVRMDDDQSTATCNEPGTPYRLIVDTPGTIDGLVLSTETRPPPSVGEVEVEVIASALNFSDVMKALGLYPGLPDGPISLGAECSGIITRIGPDVHEFSVGDEVVGVAPFTFASHTVARAELLARKPASLSFEEAATIPIAFLTASYALDRLAHVEEDERVLIHSASGGVGLAAVQLAERAGAAVLATAGTSEKREYLRQMGIAQVMDSRSVAFADEVLALTDGNGVDVILNSLPGEAIPRGLAALAECGRFLEIGKRDIYANSRIGLLPFRNNLSFYAIDLDQLMRDRPKKLGTLLRELVAEFDAKRLKPLPHQTFAVADICSAFRFMQQGKHIGKVVVSMREAPSQLNWGNYDPISFHADATYLITGGLGGFGLALAKWMVQHGARNLALMGRRGAHTPKAKRIVDELESSGARITVLKADVSKEEDVLAALKRIRTTLPPLRGVFHAAMVLEDGLLLSLDHDWMRRVMSPKVNGAWTLHTHTADDALEHFVLFSSLSSVFGHAGQGNYAAANSFLDLLTYYRRARGLPCLTVNWGYLGDVGYLAERQQLGERLERQGVMSFSIDEALEALERALQQHVIQVSVMRVNWSLWRGLGVTGKVSPRFKHLLPQTEWTDGEQSSGAASLDALHTVTGSERANLVGRLLRDKTSRLLGVAPEKLDQETPLLDVGLDSLMAVEMRNWIESQMQVDLPVVQLIRSPSLARLTELLCEQMDGEQMGPAQQEATDADTRSLLEANPEQLLANIDQLSGEQIDELLTTLLDQEGQNVED